MNAKSQQKRTLLLTYDYELFFRQSGSISRCLLQPTEKILDLARRHGGMPSTFFVDILHLTRCRNSDAAARRDFELISEQLRHMIAEGHRVELHLHPHWLDATRDDGAWYFPTYEHYRLHTLPLEQVNALFTDGARLLEEIVAPVAPTYRVRAFRAGGWCVQPCAPVATGMRAAGIDVDSTVGPGCSAAGPTHTFDFRGVLQTQPYRFSMDMTAHDPNGGNVEVPISTLRVGFLDRLARRLEMLASPARFAPFGDGVGMNVNAPSSVGARWLRYFSGKTTFLSLDDLSVLTVNRALRGSLNYLCFVSHPKLMSDYSLGLLHRIAQNSDNEFATVADAAGWDRSPS